MEYASQHALLQGVAGLKRSHVNYNSQCALHRRHTRERWKAKDCSARLAALCPSVPRGLGSYQLGQCCKEVVYGTRPPLSPLILCVRLAVEACRVLDCLKKQSVHFKHGVVSAMQPGILM